MSVKRNHFTEEELKFIEQNWRAKHDKEIGKILGRSEVSISRQRKKMGLVKPAGRPSEEDLSKGLSSMAQDGSGLSPFSLANLDKNQRLEVYKQNFKKNSRYPMLIRELHKTELEYYKHKYVEFMDSVDTITIQEEDALHHMIMSDIAISRIRVKIKAMEEANQEEDRPLVYGLYEALDKAESKFREYQKILRVTRDSRLKETKEEKESISSLMQMYRNRLAREEMGRQAGLMDIFKDKCAEEMKSSRYLLGD